MTEITTMTVRAGRRGLADGEEVAAARVREILDYSAETGLFTWKPRAAQRQWSSRYAGKKAGRTLRGYIEISLNGKRYQAHRLAWLWHYGTWPNGSLDHINRVRADNCICNLRLADKSQNNWNSKLCVRNTSGFPGVYWVKRWERWCAKIQIRGKSIHLGHFPSRELAVLARQRARQRGCMARSSIR